MISDRPSNATVAAGEEVTFHCRFNGTLDLPLWDIGGTVYSSSRLPAGFQYTEGLHIAAVWESLNNTKFTCLLIVHDGNGKLSRIQSPPAYLIVYKSYDGRNESGDQLPANSPAVTITHIVYPTPTSSINKNCSSDGLKITQCENVAIESIVGKHYVSLST